MTFRGQRSGSNPKNFEVEYLENGMRQKDDVHKSQIGSHIWTFEWYTIFQPQMIFRGQKSRSNPKNFEVEYLENGMRQRDGVHRSQIGSHIWAFRTIYFFDPSCPLGVKGQGQTLKTLKLNISKTVRDRDRSKIRNDIWAFEWSNIF